MRRRYALTLIATATAALAVAAASLPAGASPTVATRPATVRGVVLNSFEARMLADMNRVRDDHGLPPLRVASGATDVARRWSWHLATERTLSHNPRIRHDIASSGSRSWSYLEENVGYGPIGSPDELFAAYMNSPPHRANILRSQVRYVGVGVVQRGDVAWNTVDFVNEYSSSYGAPRVPADALVSQATTPSTSTVIATASTRDQRFGVVKTKGISASRVRFEGGAARARLSSNHRRGHGALVFRDALRLRHVNAIRLRLGARSHNDRHIRVAIRAGNGWRVQSLRVLHVANPRTVTIRLPRRDRRLVTTLKFVVSAASIHSAGRHVTLSVSDLAAVVR
jgi:uncharacterized protein YkwD